ncbi:MAG: PAS domain-containing protein [Treponema sp.]|jgi:signal transduction histidine kinase|nr:PAS domain-containing protein [Treponema sp.]
MADFYRRALKKLDRLTIEQCRELLVAAAGEAGRLGAVLDSIPVGILVCDENHRLDMANKSSRSLLAIGNSDSRKLWNIVPDERLGAFLKQMLANNGMALDSEIDVTLKGRNLLLSVSVVPLVRDKKVTGSLVYMEDITEKRKSESRLRQAENLASLTTLAAGVAHEIKNPLASISIHLKLAEKALARMSLEPPEKKTNTREKTPSVEKYFRVLNEEVDRLNRIVVDFLFAVRPLNLKLREANVNGIISALVDFASFEMEQNHITCFLELDENVPNILIDERLIKQALLNIIQNSYAAMPKGGLLTIATSYAQDEVRISLCDTGIGISEENLSKIFEPYYTTRDAGTGLGLTMVYKIIKEHQGEISVDSREGGGTDFRIILPVPVQKHMIEYQKEK